MPLCSHIRDLADAIADAHARHEVIPPPAPQQRREPPANPYAKPAASEQSPGPVAERLRQPKTEQPEEPSPPRTGKEDKPRVKVTNGTFSFD